MAHSGLPPPASRQPSLTYPERLRTFQGFWDDNEATARQLAAIGHVYDRPPLETLEEGSRCISCSQFVQREWSVRTLEGPLGLPNDYRDRFEGFQFHHMGCIHLQIRIPLEARAIFPPLSCSGGSVMNTKDWWERRACRVPCQRTKGRQKMQTSYLFTLPTELRLQIYAMVLPRLDDITEISTLNKDSSRIATRVGIEKTGPRDLTKTNILRTCKAIHAEALDLLYTNPTYSFENCKVLYLFLRHIGGDGRGLVKAVDIVCGSREDAITLSLLATCYNLKRIVIRLPRARLLVPRAPLWLADGVAALLELRGLQDVRVGLNSGCGHSRGPGPVSSHVARAKRGV
ncbi:hypothetical protein B0A55_13124 [Friedmanniomyces simplex]|uniref:DUF7730 domain-containing protein n=1 Tax=Friedmanniomyces simplex TaxID=329884 RepID=A0A4U0VKP0_9PEZI|nr:hypothetical protein B0A55_13124 [Friedmanniomyces simplex]